MCQHVIVLWIFFFFQAEDGIRDIGVTGVQTCALPISGILTELVWLRTEDGASDQFIPVLTPNAELEIGRVYSLSELEETARPIVEKRSEEHTSELQSRQYLVCRLLLEKKKK